MKKIIITVITYLFFASQPAMANHPFLKKELAQEAAKYGIGIDKYRQNPLNVTFHALKTKNSLKTAHPITTVSPVTLAITTAPAKNLQNCPKLLHAGSAQEFGIMEKIANEQGTDIYLLPKGSKMSALYISHKKGQCIGMHGSAGQKADVEGNARLAIFKTVIRSF